MASGGYQKVLYKIAKYTFDEVLGELKNRTVSAALDYIQALLKKIDVSQFLEDTSKAAYDYAKRVVQQLIDFFKSWTSSDKSYARAEWQGKLQAAQVNIFLNL